QVLSSLPGYVDKIIVVDDCSTDDTFRVATASVDSRVVVIKTAHNCGIGEAMCLGYQRALDLGGEVLVKMDGDGQMAPEHLALLLDSLIEKGYDYAKGNRFLHSEAINQMPAARITGNIVLTFLTKAASGYWHIFDPQNGYTAIKADALRVLSLDKIHKRYFFENDMLIHLNFFGFRVKDVAIPSQYGEEESGINLVQVSSSFP